MSSCEVYIYLGQDEYVMYFLHTVHNSNYNNTLDAQIYNCLISEQMIMNHDKKCVIWTVNKDSSVSTTIVGHADAKRVIEMNEKHMKGLKKKMEKCMTAKRDKKFMIFIYRHDAKVFENHINVEMELDLPNKSDLKGVKFHEPVQFNTTKSIDYLDES